MTKNDQLQTGTILLAQAEKSKVTVMVSLEDTAAMLAVNLMGYDDVKKEYVEDEEALKRGIDNLKKLGADEELVENLNASSDLTEVANSLVGNEVEVYYANDRASLFPIKEYVKSSKITPSMYRSLKKLKEPVRLFKFDEFTNVRFQGYFKFDDGGEEKNIRVSQIKIAGEGDAKDTVVSLKYLNKGIETTAKSLESGLVSDAMKPKVEEAYKQLLLKARQAKVEELKQVLDGRSIDDMIENGDSVMVELELKEVPTKPNEDPAYYVVAEVVEQYPEPETEE